MELASVQNTVSVRHEWTNTQPSVTKSHAESLCQYLQCLVFSLHQNSHFTVL